MSASLSGALPKGAGNGLAGIVDELVSNPSKVHVAVILFDTSKITKKVDDGDIVPTVRIRRIEAISDEADRKRLRMLLEREYERRTGRAPLPFELEEDIRSAFEGDPPGRD